MLQRFAFGLLACLILVSMCQAEGTQSNLESIGLTSLTARVQSRGDARRGALIFYKSAAACAACHVEGSERSALGPSLTKLGPETTEASVIESILHPSKSIRTGYETIKVLTDDGSIYVGLLSSEDDKTLRIRSATDLQSEIEINKEVIEERVTSNVSLMPEGLVAALRQERDFYDLVRYIVEIARGGATRAAELKPDDSLLIVRDDTLDLDHAGILQKLNADDFAVGKKIYSSDCSHCHGLDGNTPSLPTARAFGTQKLKYGADPYSMLKTLTKGNGLMTAMQHLSPKERYQVVHFVRENFMRDSNPDYVAIDQIYLNQLPKGTSDGDIELGGPRDFGPVLASQFGTEVNDSLTFRLSDQLSLNYDLHRLRVSDVWQGGFLNLSQTQHYRQRGEGMPERDGTSIPSLANYGWVIEESFASIDKFKSPRGPINPEYAIFRGYYSYGDQAILNYKIYDREILELIEGSTSTEANQIQHNLHVKPGAHSLRLCVGKQNDVSAAILSAPSAGNLLAIIAESKITVDAIGASQDLKWSLEDNYVILNVPANDDIINLCINRSIGLTEKIEAKIVDVTELTHGGKTRWPELLETTVTQGEPVNGYALDTIEIPKSNPWNAWLRTSALDFFSDGRAAIATYGGDIYIVSGLNLELNKVTWKRFAAGLFEPFGVRIVNEKIYVTCRDGIKCLHDDDNNGEADFIEAFWNDTDVSGKFHAFDFDLQSDSTGNFYIAKAGQYTDYNVPGAVLKIPPSGGEATIYAWGIRTPNGMGILPDDRITISDNQGPWIPAGKISVAKPDSFLGSMPTADSQNEWVLNRFNGELPTDFEQPFIWLPQELDNSCGGQIWNQDTRWGPLSNRLIHSSFGKGWLYYLSLQNCKGTDQASIVALPHQWDAGVMRLRVNPTDGQVYGVGLSGWQGPPDGKDGCFQRLRHTGAPVRLISDSKVVRDGIELTFSFPLNKSAEDTKQWSVKMWNYLWSQKYGSDQFSILKSNEVGQDILEVQSVTLSPDRKTATLILPELQKCNQLYLDMELEDEKGLGFSEEIYMTINAMPE